jgi:hypothetical protein
MVIMNRLERARQVQIVKCLCEGMSVRGTVRLTGVAKNTIVKLLSEVGGACAEFHDKTVRKLNVRRLQCNEIRSFIIAKSKNATPEQKEQGAGDVWTWTAIDADTKFCISYLAGGRTTGWAEEFMLDCASRIIGRPQITTEAHKPYLKAVELALAGDADYAMLRKIHKASNQPGTHYSAAKVSGAEMKPVNRAPYASHASASLVKRQHLTMSMRRFMRLTDAFSKKLENHAAAISLYFAYYNFCRVHSTLRLTPAMKAGISDHILEIEDLVNFIHT